MDLQPLNRIFDTSPEETVTGQEEPADRESQVIHRVANIEQLVGKAVGHGDQFAPQLDVVEHEHGTPFIRDQPRGMRNVEQDR